MDHVFVLLSWSTLYAIARGAGFALAVPPIGFESTSVRPRILLAIVLALMIRMSNRAELPSMQSETVFELALTELGTGLVLGFTLRLMHNAIFLVAQAVEQLLGLAGAIDTLEEVGSGVRSLYHFSVLAMFLCLSGHRFVVAALIRAPDAAAVTGWVEYEQTVFRVANLAWCLAIESALPLIAALAGTHLAFGMIARVTPQFSGSVALMPIQMLLGLALILVSLGSIAMALTSGSLRLVAVHSS